MDIPQGWNICTVDKLKSHERYACVAGPFGSNISSKYFVNEGIPVIRGVNLTDDLTRFVSKNFVFVSESKAESLKAQKVKGGDLVFTCWGTLGQVGLIPENGPYSVYIISNKQLKLRINKKICDEYFLFYYFASAHMVQHIRNIAIGAAVPGINLGILKALKVILPPLSTQKKIAAILSAYDDLIENNKRRIALLEKMAEEIYREWFVRFRFPGHDNAKFIKGVPDGWKTKKLGDIIELCYGKALKANDRIPGEYHVFGSGGIVGTHHKSIVKEPGLIVGRKGNVGSIYLSDRGFFPIDTVYYVRSKLSIHYLFYLLQTMNFINNDAAVPGLNRKQAYSNFFFLPPINLIDKFVKIANNNFKMRQNLIRQNECLTKSRVMLLPRLISGKLSVENLDIQFPPSMLTEQETPTQEPAYG